MLGKVWRVLISVLIASLPAVVVAAPVADEDSADVAPAAQMQPRGVFVERCRFSHAAPDDPIVQPRRPGGSHLHDFFGNVTTNAFSTPGSLRAGGTTCLTRPDASGYWTPSLYREGELVRPRSATIYYRSAPAKPSETIRPFPAGFRVVAGDARATAPQAGNVTWWTCRGTMQRSQTPPDCAPGTVLNLHVRFPPCWDGRSLDSADHRSHMAYARRGACPSTHPVHVPALTMIVHYPVRDAMGQVSLSSGGVYSGHADFFNAWDQAALTARVNRCLNGRQECRPRR